MQFSRLEQDHVYSYCPGITSHKCTVPTAPPDISCCQSRVNAKLVISMKCSSTGKQIAARFSILRKKIVSPREPVTRCFPSGLHSTKYRASGCASVSSKSVSPVQLPRTFYTPLSRPIATFFLSADKPTVQAAHLCANSLVYNPQVISQNLRVHSRSPALLTATPHTQSTCPSRTAMSGLGLFPLPIKQFFLS